MEKTYNIKEVKKYLNQVIDEETKIMEKNLKERKSNFNTKKVIEYV